MPGKRRRSTSQSQDRVYGGLNYRFLEDGQDIAKFTCPVCALVAREPQQVSCCGHIYCSSCLDQLKKRRRSKSSTTFKCPTCSHTLTDGDYFPDKRVKLDINSLKVYCLNSDLVVNKNEDEALETSVSCDWVGELHDLDTHLQQSCPLQCVLCTQGCGSELNRHTLSTHLQEDCPKRLIPCDYCTTEGCYEHIIGNHINECPQYPLQCSAEGCDEIVVRGEMMSHKETCPKEIILCEYNSVGCTGRFRREEQEEHDDQSVRKHLQLAVHKVKEMEMKQEELKEEVTVKSVELELEIEERDKNLRQIVLQNKELVAKCDRKVANFEVLLQLEESQKVGCREYLKMTNFSNYARGSYWKSRKFLSSHKNGYCMYLRVHSYFEANIGYISCYVCFTQGEYDDTLEWPFQGKVTIALLNQLEDRDHLQRTLHFGESAKQCQPTNSQDSAGFGYPSFATHKDLQSKPNCQLLKDDTLYFRVSTQHNPSMNTPWLFGNN